RIAHLEEKVDVALVQSGTPGPQGPQGPAGKDGKDAQITDAQIQQITQTVTANVLAQIKTPEIPAAQKHYVLVADQDASYWPRLSDWYKRASDSYSRIKLAAPPTFPVGTLPQLVEYQGGDPLRVIKGNYDTEAALAKLARGDTP